MLLSLGRRLLLSCCLGVVLCMAAQAQQIVMREVIATGNGGDPSKATIDAIENAIAQVGGMRISTATSLEHPLNTAIIKGFEITW